MDAADWNTHYASKGQHWTAPNPWVYSEMNGARAGKALDLGSGDGRHAVWLAERGWRVEAVDFSILGLEIGTRRAEAKRVQDRIAWTMCDVTAFAPVPGSVDLVLVAYLNLPEIQLKKVLATAVGTLAPGGRLLFINNEAAPLPFTPSPQGKARAFLTPGQIAGWLRSAGLHIDTVESLFRPVPGERQPAVDCLILGSAPYSAALRAPAREGTISVRHPEELRSNETASRSSLRPSLA
ncbi:MAG: methyltransferase domain-containing protein [Specibacter sp.]